MTPQLVRRFDRLEAARHRALATLEGFDATALNRPPAAGKWSALQVLHHVVTAEALTLGYVRKKVQAGQALPPAGPASRLRLLLVQATLASPLRVRAPGPVASVPPQIDPAELCARWQELRLEWRGFIESFPGELLGRLVFRHPYAGRMTLDHALGTLQAHLDHHVPQVERALSTGASLSAPASR